MNSKEVSEIKKRTKKDAAEYKMSAAYIKGGEISTFPTGYVSSMEDATMFKWLDTIKKTLSGKVGDKLIGLSFPMEAETEGGQQNLLKRVLDSGLGDNELLNVFFQHIHDTYDMDGNYIVALFHEVYDVPDVAKDGADLEESTTTFPYIICSICPVQASKPSLEVTEDEVKAAGQDMLMCAPDNGFLFPVFNDRSSNLHECLYFSRSAKNMHEEFIQNGLGCQPVPAISMLRENFFNMLEETDLFNGHTAAENICLFKHYLDFEVTDFKLQHEIDTPVLLTEEMISQVLIDMEVPERLAEAFPESVYKDVLDPDNVPPAEAFYNDKELEDGELLMKIIDLQKQVVELTKENGDLKYRLEGRN